MYDGLLVPTGGAATDRMHQGYGDYCGHGR